VQAAQVAMATELNVDVLTSMGFDVPAQAGPNDLVIALRTDTPDAVAAGLAAVADALAALRATSDSGGGDDTVAPRTLGSAAARVDATLAVISVPGQHAVTEAFDAITSGLSVMLFSDNVSVEDEVHLKDAAAAADVLVMGPDCGTAHIGGVALGFANVVRPGSVGIVAASGTGAQQVCACSTRGVGISHCLGVGGRDLKAAVGGRSTRQALHALAADPATDRVIVVSKPPDAAVLADLEAPPTSWGCRCTGRCWGRAAPTSRHPSTSSSPRGCRCRRGQRGLPPAVATTRSCPGAPPCVACSAEAPSPTRRSRSPRVGWAASTATSRTTRPWRSAPTCATTATSSSTSVTTG
jgi:FdrA protein